MVVGGCAWLPGEHAWLPGGMHGCGGWVVGMHGCRGCVCGCGVFVVVGGMHGCREAYMVGGRGHAWLWGACMVVGVHGCRGGVHRIQRDTVNEQAVRILLVCILVYL